MAYVLKQIVYLHYYWNDECSDPRVKDWFMMSNPFPMFGVMALYLAIVLKWGPEFMKNRKPYKLDTLIQVYNAVQVIICGFLVIESFRLCYTKGYNWFCEPVDFSENPRAVTIAKRVYLYHGLKVLDLLDTVFFILRKKQNQVTFLHVYHHAGMVLLTWIATKYVPGGHGVFMGAMNSFVHVVMYSYYFLTSYSPKFKQNVWWKKYITQLQLVQFFFIFLHFLILLLHPSCDYPKFTAGALIPQNLFMFVLFGDFYYRAYVKKPKKSSSGGKNVASTISDGEDIKKEIKTSDDVNDKKSTKNLLNKENRAASMDGSEKVISDVS